MIPCVLNEGSATKSILRGLKPLLNTKAEQFNSPAFNYTIFRSKDYTLGHHTLDRYNTVLR